MGCCWIPGAPPLHPRAEALHRVVSGRAAALYQAELSIHVAAVARLVFPAPGRIVVHRPVARPRLQAAKAAGYIARKKGAFQ